MPADDDRLVALISVGDHLAFAHLMTDRMKATVGHAYRLLRDRHEAEDIAQEAMLRVWVSAASWQRSTGTFSTWLYRVVHNLCVDRMRATKRANLVSLDAADNAVDPALGPADAAMRREIDVIIADAIASLPARQAAAIRLAYYQGLDNVVAARMLGVSEPALESLLSRGRRQLKEHVARLADRG